MIHSYVFGRITINGQEFNNDIRISWDGSLIPEWWRRKGHVAEIEDVEPVISDGTEVFVLGKGEPGMMKASSALRAYLKRKNIKLIEEPTKKAARIVNSLNAEGVNFAAGFHLTC